MSPSNQQAPASQAIRLGRNPRWAWLAFAIFALTGVGLFFLPAFVIRPFRSQGPRALLLSLALRQRAPWGTLVAAVVCIVLALAMWTSVSKWGKTLLAAALVLVAFSAVMARMNYFEWMFHPIATPGFEAEAASKLDAGEMIMAVRLGSDARAYPISEMAYHHILNDVVNGVPIAVTY
jgi:uncharacterized protein DUF3179